MEQMKVCMLGAGGVGKTSLVARLTGRGFLDIYPSTIGVNIRKHPVVVDGRTVNLIVWDRSAEDEVRRVRSTYLRGCSGYVLVVDGTRPETLERAEALHAWMRETAGPLPFVLLLNKADLEAEWALPDEKIEALRSSGWNIHTTSARTNRGIEEAFVDLGRQILADGAGASSRNR